MATVARLKTEGLLLSGELDERLPPITSGLVSHYPLDDRGGAFDMISGNQPVQNVTKGVNLIEAMKLDWRDPSSWQSSAGAVWDDKYQAMKWTGYHNTWLKTPIIVDPTKTYQISIEVMEEVQSGTGLYLGGYALNSIGQKVTTNYDYTMAANAQPTTGVWTTFRLTRTGTAVAGSGNSYSFDTVKGWGGNVQTDPLTYFYHFGGLFNYSTGGVMYTRNLSIVAIDADTSNTTITSEGLAVEVATTNIIPDGDFSGGLKAPYSSVSGSGTIAIEFSPELGKNVLKHSNLVAGESVTLPHNGASAVLSSAANGQTWTGQIKVRAEVPNTTVEMFIFGMNASNQYMNYSAGSMTIQPEDGWVLLSKTHTFTDPLVVNIATRIDLNTVGTVRWSDWQLEQTQYPTSFVNGSRSAGQCAIYNPVMTGDYTVNFKCKINTNIGNTASYQTIMSMGNYYTNNSWTIMDTGSATVQGTQRLIRKGNAAEWAWIGANLTETSNFNEENVITVVRNSTNYRVYGNGVYKGTIAHLSTTMQDKIWIGGRDSGNSVASSVIRDVSIYNRALSDAEVATLATNKFKLIPNGNLVNEITEQPLMPSDVTYFPLGFDGNSEYDDIVATTASNLVHRDGSVFVGSGTTNIFANADFSNGLTSWNRVEGEAVVLYPGTITLRRNVAGAGNFQLNQSFSMTIGDNLSFSIEIKRIAGGLEGTDNFGFGFGSWGCLPAWNYTRTRTEPLGDGWFRLYYNLPTLTNTITATTGIHSMTNDLTIVYQMRNLMLEKKPYSSPFSASTLGESNLHLPYNIIDCKVDFTIFGFWKPSVYADGIYRPCITRNVPSGNSTYNRILIMGDGTTSRRLRTWHGSDGLAESATYAPSTIDVLDNEWNFFAFVRSGANILLYLGNSSGFGSGSTATAYRLDADETGQVWQIGEYSNNESDAYHRDYGFVQRAMSSTELQSVFNTKMRAYSDTINIGNQVIEGVTL